MAVSAPRGRPGLAIVFSTSGNGFRTVEYRTAAHRKNHVNLLFLADTHAFHYTSGVFGVWFDTTQFKNLKIFQQFFHAVVQADTLDASATVCLYKYIPVLHGISDYVYR